MKLIDKIQKAHSNKPSDYSKVYTPTAEIIEQIAEEFARDFAEWTWNKELITINDCGYFEYKFNLYTRKELLEIFKNDKKL
jgi:hypothetical protein